MSVPSAKPMHLVRITVAAMTCLAGCAQSPVAQTPASSKESAPAVVDTESTANKTSETPEPMPYVDQFVTTDDIPQDIVGPSGFVLVRDYVDSVKTPQGDQYQRVEYGWDYSKGIALMRRSTLEGAPIESVEQPALTLVPTKDEMMFAYHLVAIHPELSAIARRKDARLYGGFSLREPGDKFCNKASRCVHVMISGGDNGELALGHAIVDLMRQKVVYPFYEGSPRPKS